MNKEEFSMEDNSDVTISLKDAKNAPTLQAPMIVLSNQVIFPFNLSPLVITENNLTAIESAMSNGRVIAIFPEMATPAEFMASKDIHGQLTQIIHGDKKISKAGTLCRIIKKLNFPDGTIRILVRGMERISLLKIETSDQILSAFYAKVTETEDNSKELAPLVKNAVSMFQELGGMGPGIPEEFRIAVLNINSPSRIADVIADAVQMSLPEKILLLAMPSVKERLYNLTILLNRNIEIIKLGNKIQSDVHNAMSQSQKEYFLQEQLKAIKKELGEDTRNPDIIDIEKRLKEQKLPEKVEAAIQKELARLEVIPQMSPEYHVAYNYVDTLLNVPWNICSDSRLDVKAAEAILNADHYGLKDVKERILEFLSVLQLKSDRKSPIICLVGPPGVGKTSLGQSIARALNREFVRMSLGGVRDEAEIRGHRRTYIGAMPGRIIQNLIKVKSANPVFMLDEIDKLSSDFRGDPASALLEVLDSSQNSTFSDHYIEHDFDLSRVFFIATANTTDSIPEPLLDRMELIRLPGYTAFEKREIARKYLVKRSLEANALDEKLLKIGIPAINEIIDYYTREAGVRQLERIISQCCRKVARKVVDGEYAADEKITLTPKIIHNLLGCRKFTIEEAEKQPEAGSATGMAWTSVGGVLLVIETLMIPGKGNLKLTGSLGKVMQESAEAAFTYIKYRAENWGINPEIFEKHDIHIHVPDGATPKDGPSAGITIASALYSLFTNQKVKPFLSMTGEINLRGKITIIGGVKEKVIAALRSGIKEIVLPEENRKDLEEIPDEIKNGLKFHFVRNFDEAVKIIF